MSSSNQADETDVSRVESVDFSQESIDSQYAQLAQARLERKIDQETYSRLIANLRALNWELPKPIEYAKPTTKARPTHFFLKTIVATINLLLLALIVESLFTQRNWPNSSEVRVTVARTDISNLEMALDEFAADTGRYPSTAEGLAAMICAPAGAAATWKGPYLAISSPSDPWGRPYVYEFPGKHNPSGYDLSSDGDDGIAGTSDDICNYVK